MTRLDPRSPLVFDTRELGRRAGLMVPVQREVPAPEDLGTDVLTVVPGSPVELDLRLESVVEGVLVSGTAQAVASGACVRCLDDVTYPVSADVQELFAYADRARHHAEVSTEDEDDDLRELDGDQLDLEPVLRDSIVPMLPFQPVCRADCPGLCSQCGARLADDPDHHHDVLDPRWAALQGLAGTGDSSSTTTNEKRN